MPTFTVGTEAADAIDVTIQLKDQQGRALAEVGAAEVWLSDASKGALCAAAPTGGWALQASSVKLSEPTANKIATWLSHTDGKITIRVTDSGAKSFYVNVRTPGSNKVTSQIITFA